MGFIFSLSLRIKNHTNINCKRKKTSNYKTEVLLAQEARMMFSLRFPHSPSWLVSCWMITYFFFPWKTVQWTYKNLPKKAHSGLPQKEKSLTGSQGFLFCRDCGVRGSAGNRTQDSVDILLLSCTPNLKMVVFVFDNCCLSEIGSYLQHAGWPWTRSSYVLSWVLRLPVCTITWCFCLWRDFFCTEHWMFGFIHVKCFPPELSPQPSLI